MKKFLIIFSLLFMRFGTDAQVVMDNDATPLHRAEKALTDVIVRDIFSPPVASRIYVYANMAAYEVLVKSNGAYKSLYKQVKAFPGIPAPQNKISSSLAAVHAFLLTGMVLKYRGFWKTTLPADNNQQDDRQFSVDARIGE